MDKKKLVIVESPAKSNTISKYLGAEFIVGSSMGHVRDLSPRVLSIDVENGYEPHYEELKDKKKIIDHLKRLSRKSGDIFLAPDPDREGEAIAYHLQQILKEVNPRIRRIFFNEITRNAVLQSIENPQDIDMDKVNSQQMRRLLDRLAGYKISPVLQKKMGGPLSAGRVQSVALRLIVDRERDIQAFEPEEYWTVTALLEGSSPPPFEAKLEKRHNRRLKISDKAQCDEVLGELKAGEYRLQRVTSRSKQRKPPPPLITSTLQQEAFRRFGYPVKKTMRLAQQLYEGIDLKPGERVGLITYMRTDSYRIAAGVRREAKSWILSTFGEAFYPEKANVFGSKKKIQDAHETIRPTFPFHAPETVKNQLDQAQFRVYQLIWERFFASQMSNCKLKETAFDIVNGPYHFNVKGEVTTFAGFHRMLPSSRSEQQLPPLEEGEVLELKKLTPKQNFTKPPARYTEATLVKTLEEKGIGRPSTYAKTIDTLGKREYIRREDKRFVPTWLGIKVVEYLETHFQDIMDYEFTAKLEKQLDMVADGSLDWRKGIDLFYERLKQDLEKVSDSRKIELRIGKPCPECGKELVTKYSPRTAGWFVGCSGYPDCTFTQPMEQDAGAEKKGDQPLDKTCPKCGEPLVKRYSRKTRQYFIGCTGYPQCNHLEALEKESRPCPQCGKPLVRRFSRKTRRAFYGCSGFPECRYIEKTR